MVLDADTAMWGGWIPGYQYPAAPKVNLDKDGKVIDEYYVLHDETGYLDAMGAGRELHHAYRYDKLEQAQKKRRDKQTIIKVTIRQTESDVTGNQTT